MKIEFYDPFQNENLKYQKEAIEAVTDIFKGQGVAQTLFGVREVDLVGTEQTDVGVGNRLTLGEEELLKNIQQIQKRNALEITQSIDKGDLNFSIEMETGTGKTYVFLRTIFELNRLYGFKKFIIVVPSIAIKEGVKKNLDITREHFRALYGNTPYNYFIYDSSKLTQINGFVRSGEIEIMIINIDAFNKSKNIINNPQEATFGEKPIDVIASTRPIVIIDEPQSVDTTDKAKKAIKSLNPLFILRYSATHREKYNLMYKLDPIDAYERRLVKQIEVASIKLSDTSNLPYIKFISVDNKKGIKAKVEVEVFQGGEVKRKKKTLKGNSDLFEITGRDIYNGYLVREIYAEKGREYIEFANGKIVRLGESIGEVDPEQRQYLQIKKTIEEHLEKEKLLLKRGIKVLSLFFIDRVANYRSYDSEGNPQKGKFVEFFEKAFQEVIQLPKFQELYEKIYKNLPIDQIHDGYFSVDKKGKLKDTSGKTKADESTYGKIMKNKEKLLSLEEPLRFIFSHSALREGWDNPNVFQICTLNETKSTIKKRQEIGRGLRLCVNSRGERVYGFDVNRLTIIANESYREFAEKLQKEYEEDLGIKFGVVEKRFFYPILGEEGEKLFQFLQEKGYLDGEGRVKEKLKREIENLPLPNELEPKRKEIVATLQRVIGRKIKIEKAEERRKVRLRKEVILSEDFKNLWERIKHKTIYKIEFDGEKLVEKCIERINREVAIGEVSYRYEKAKIEIDRGEVRSADETDRVENLVNISFQLPDIVTFLQGETNLKRQDIIRILTGTSKLSHFRRNPQKFMEAVGRIIKEELSRVVVEGVKYEKIAGAEYAVQEIFEKGEIVAYLKNLKESQKSLYDRVICDSEVEKRFVEEFNKNENVKLFAKLPKNFKIETPVGSYNPDWAVVMEVDGKEKLYFVLESKGSLGIEGRREKENQKILCAQRHFETLEREYRDFKYLVEKDFEGFRGRFYTLKFE
ncbi:MAG: type III restriction endonuclease subunit R [Epsilonproteobacteria bacterium]|nr:type III restriction endonuclease subunit R [Campylobacterota bacterium]NPA88595.1 DEAD/DEAH box helicase family protein [Campylobacterota bacterium]